MPALVTGLPYDIDYNYKLSDIDKAYMCIMYARPAREEHPRAPGWTLEYALSLTGIVEQDPDTSARILQIADGDSTWERVRDLFSEWSRTAHRINEDGTRQLDTNGDVTRENNPDKQIDTEELSASILQKLLAADDGALKQALKKALAN